MKKSILSVLCLLLLFVGIQYQPASIKAETNNQGIQYIKPDMDPGYGSAHYDIGETYKAGSNKITFDYGSRNSTSSYTGGGYIHNTKFDSQDIVNGVDVYSGTGTVDWAKVKASGIDFAFIKVGARYGSTGGLAADAKYKTNINGAVAAGLKVGVYFFSQAITTAEAQEEANYALSLISGYKVTMPVVMDYEYETDKNNNNNSTGRLYSAGLSKDAATANVNAFSSTISANGYTPMLYADKNFLTNKLNASALTSKVWLAHYTSQTTYTGDYTCWQYSSKGSVTGISGNADVDFWYGSTTNIAYPYNGIYQGVDYSAVFDPTYYAQNNQDVVKALGSDSDVLLQHFVTYGMNEGRQANSAFNPSIYKQNYSDLSSAFGSNTKQYYMHYISNGKAEGRTANDLLNGSVWNGVDYSNVYDYTYYTANNADVAKAVNGSKYQAIQHFINCGMNEGRRAISTFDVKAYKAQYKDLRQAFGTNNKLYYMHYINSGKTEKRTATGSETITDGITTLNGTDYSSVYNYNYYIANNKDVAAAFPNDDIAVLQHFVNNGMSEGRTASATFDVKAYRATYKDLRLAFGNNYKQYFSHYMSTGKTEGRTATGSETITDGITTLNGVDYSAVYNYNYYITANPDVAAAYPNDDIAALNHFVTFGMTEGRTASADFVLSVYKTKYPDLVSAFGNQNQLYYEHYIQFGKAEGRSAKPNA